MVPARRKGLIAVRQNDRWLDLPRVLRARRLTFWQRASLEAAMLLAAIVVGSVWVWMFVCCWLSQ
jgi:hypothetical protein